MKKKPQRFAVLDRDGTVIFERHHLSRPHEVELIPGAALGLRHLKDIGLGLVVITNQSGVGRGFFDCTQLDRIHHRMDELLTKEGVHLDGIYYCPHTPEEECLCRKPRPQLVERAASDLQFDPSQSFVIGDKPCDIDLGRNVGATTILVRSGYGRQTLAERLTNPDYVTNDVGSAAEIIKDLMSASVSR